MTRCVWPSAGLVIHAKGRCHHPGDRPNREHRPGRPLWHDGLARSAGPEVQRRLGVADPRIEIGVATAPAVEIAGKGFPDDPGVLVGQTRLRHVAIQRSATAFCSGGSPTVSRMHRSGNWACWVQARRERSHAFMTPLLVRAVP